MIGLFDASANVVQTLEYKPWGDTTVVTGALADTSRRRWTGLMWEGDVTQ